MSMDCKEIKRDLYKKTKNIEVKRIRKFKTFDSDNRDFENNKVWRKDVHQRFNRFGKPHQRFAKRNRGCTYVLCFWNEISKKEEYDQLKTNIKRINLADLEDEEEAFQREIMINTISRTKTNDDTQFILADKIVITNYKKIK
jgi:hypothetical protein